MLDDNILQNNVVTYTRGLTAAKVYVEFPIHAIQ